MTVKKQSRHRLTTNNLGVYFLKEASVKEYSVLIHSNRQLIKLRERNLIRFSKMVLTFHSWPKHVRMILLKIVRLKLMDQSMTNAIKTTRSTRKSGKVHMLK